MYFQTSSFSTAFLDDFTAPFDHIYFVDGFKAANGAVWAPLKEHWTEIFLRQTSPGLRIVWQKTSLWWKLHATWRKIWRRRLATDNLKLHPIRCLQILRNPWYHQWRCFTELPLSLNDVAILLKSSWLARDCRIYP